MHFSHQNTKLYAAVSALQPENSSFLDVKMVQPLLDLVDCTSVEAQFDIAKTYIEKLNSDEKTKPTTKLFCDHCEALKAMPTVHLSLKLRGVTHGASSAKCENSFSVLNTIKRDRRQSMKHARKVHLVQLAFESDLTKKLKTDWKENVFREFSTSNRRLQLFQLNSVDIKLFRVLCFRELVPHLCVFS